MIETIIKAHQFFIEGQPKFQVFKFLLENLLQISDSEYGFIGEILYKDGMPFLRTNAITNIAWNEELRKKYDNAREIGFDFMNLDNLFGLVIMNNEVIISNDPKNDTRRGNKYKIPQGHPPLNAFAGIPFHHNKQMIGMVGIANRPGGYTDEYIEYLSPFINTCSTLIAHYKAEDNYKQLKDKYENFIGQVSHDMRTPLNGIIGYKQLFEIEFQDMMHHNQKFKSYLQEIENCSEKLLELIDKILSITKTRININLTDMNLSDMIVKMVSMVKPLADRNNIKIYNNILRNITINTDHKIFEDIISNLLTNAIKYNKLGGSITLESKTLNNNLISIYITDTGCGITESDLNEIFMPFYRGENIKHINGKGIGLTTVKKYCDLVNIEIDVKSRIGEGSSFILTLPYKSQEMLKSIIYVEDDLINQRLVKSILEQEYHVDVAATVENAKSAITQNEYNLYILDYNLPDGNSLELLDYISDKNKVIILTADASDKTKQLVARRQIKYYLTKPFNIQEFVKIVKNLDKVDK